MLVRLILNPIWLVILVGAFSPRDDGEFYRDCALPEELSGSTAFVGVSIVDTEKGRLLKNQSVVIQGDRITDVGPADKVSIPEDATRIERCDLVVAPGLADMHVHIRQSDLRSYLEAGVTTVRNLWGYPDLKRIQSEIENGVRVGPVIHSHSPGLDGTPVKWPVTQLVMKVEEASEVVRTQSEAGWTSLKLYSDLRSDVFEAVVEAANARGLTFGGHVPHRVGLQRALAVGYRHIEHLSGYEMELNPDGPRGAFAWTQIDESKIEELATMTAAAGTWNCPTLAIFSMLARGDETVVGNRRKMVKALFDAEAPLLIGTDAGIDRTAPGSSLHDEIEEFRRAGLKRKHVLNIATVQAAKFLGQENEFGQIQKGFRADLLLLEKNPLDNLSTLAKPAAVIARGRLVN